MALNLKDAVYKLIERNVLILLFKLTYSIIHGSAMLIRIVLHQSLLFCLYVIEEGRAVQIVDLGEK